MGLAETLENRLWAKIKVAGPDECWDWQGYLSPDGYGRILNVKGKTQIPHRIVWELEHGPIPDGMVIMHKCDRPCCCNPAHLQLGTQQDNMADMKAKMRHAHGERHRDAILTEEQVLAIRESPLRNKDIAPLYGVTEDTISDIRLGRKWKHVGGPVGKRPRQRRKVTQQQIDEIRALPKTPTKEEAAERWGLSYSYAWVIWKRKPLAEFYEGVAT